MSRKTNIMKRIRLINGGREPYLSFLRNITPQIILLSTVWLASGKFTFPPTLDLKNTLDTMPFFALIGCFVLAVYANISHFWDSCFHEYEVWFTKYRRRIAIAGLKGVRLKIELLKGVLRFKLVETLEIVSFFIAITVIALAIVIGMSMHSAKQIWKNLHPATTYNLIQTKSEGRQSTVVRMLQRIGKSELEKKVVASTIPYRGA